MPAAPPGPAGGGGAAGTAGGPSFNVSSGHPGEMPQGLHVPPVPGVTAPIQTVGPNGEQCTTLPFLMPGINPTTGEMPMLGWDSNLTGALGVGLEGEGEVFAGMGAGYSFPIKEWVITPQAAMLVIRLAVALVKMGMNLATMNGTGALRDGIGAIGGLIDDLTDGQIVGPIVNWVIPMPGGE